MLVADRHDVISHHQHLTHESHQPCQGGPPIAQHQATFRLRESQWQGVAGKRSPSGDFIHPGQPVSGGPNDTSVGEISVKTENNARNGGKNSQNRLIRCVCGKKIGPDPRNFNQRVSLGRNDLLIRTFPKWLCYQYKKGDKIALFEFCITNDYLYRSAVTVMVPPFFSHWRVIW